jgi:multisubunit Na+/H+ antiporter MnhB subunit
MVVLRAPTRIQTGADAMNSYAKFGAMIATATLVMLGLMDLNTYRWDHVFFSETRAYMALVMGASMAIIMLAFMRNM